MLIILTTTTIFAAGSIGMLAYLLYKPQRARKAKRFR